MFRGNGNSKVSRTNGLTWVGLAKSFECFLWRILFIEDFQCIFSNNLQPTFFIILGSLLNSTSIPHHSPTWTFYRAKSLNNTYVSGKRTMLWRILFVGIFSKNNARTPFLALIIVTVWLTHSSKLDKSHSSYSFFIFSSQGQIKVSWGKWR